MILKNEPSRPEKKWMNLKCILLSERSQSEKATCIPYDPNPMTFWKRQNYGDSKKICGCERFGGRENRKDKQWDVGTTL